MYRQNIIFSNLKLLHGAAQKSDQASCQNSREILSKGEKEYEEVWLTIKILIHGSNVHVVVVLRASRARYGQLEVVLRG